MRSGLSTIDPNQLSTPLRSASTEMNAISMTAMLAIKPIEMAAPTDNASNIFFSSLHGIGNEG